MSVRKILRHLSERRPGKNRSRTQSLPYDNKIREVGNLTTISESNVGNPPTDANNNNPQWNATEKFQDSKICSIIDEILKSYLKQFDCYDHDLSSRLGVMLSDLIRSKACDIFGESWKVVANVYIGAVSDHGLAVASQCFWIPECDKFASASFENDYLFAFGVVFAVFCQKPEILNEGKFLSPSPSSVRACDEGR